MKAVPSGPGRASPRVVIALGAIILSILATACGTRVNRTATVDAATAGTPHSLRSGTPAGSSTSQVPDPASEIRTSPTGAHAAHGRSIGSPSLRSSPRGETPSTSPRDESPRSSPRGDAVISDKAVTRARKSPVVIGSVGALSGPVGATLKAGVLAVQVWVRYINDRGGLNGHPVTYITADDGFDPARHRALTQDLVENKRVLAFVYNPEGSGGQASLEYLEKKRIPVIGNDGGGNFVYESPMYFPYASAGDELALGSVAALASRAMPTKDVKLGTLVCSEVSNCHNFESVWNSPRALKFGFQAVYRGRATLTQPDFTAECLAARNAGVRAMLVALDSNTLTRLANSCARQGYRPIYGQPGATAQAFHLAADSLEGSTIGTGVFAFPSASTAASKEFHAAMGDYAPAVGVAGGHADGWVAAKLFQEAAKSIAEPPMTAQILDGLWSMRNNDLGGLTYPLIFERDKPAARRACWAIVVIRGGLFVADDEGRLTCETSP